MKSIEYIQTNITNGNMDKVDDNESYNILVSQPQLYALIRSARTRCVKMKLTGLYRYENKEYLTFETEEPINNETTHGIEYVETSFDDIYNYDKVAIDALKNNFKNINRVAIDYGYSSLYDFISTYDRAMEEIPERMI